MKLQQIGGEILVGMKSTAVGRWLVWCLGYAPDFNGRMDRANLGVHVAIVVSIYILMISAAEILGPTYGPPNTFDALTAMLNMIIPGIVLFSAIVRRLHDCDREGLAMLVAIIPYAGPFILIGMLLQEGNPQTNGFGAPPI